jgi:hypothetical protein
MATINDICIGALRKLGVISGSETPSANDAGFCRDELNDMMLEMQGQQVFLNWTALQLADTFPLEDHHIGGVKAMLAVRVSPGFGGDGLLTRETIRQANDGYSRLWGDYHRPDELSVDEGLADMPGLWHNGLDNVNV